MSTCIHQFSQAIQIYLKLKAFFVAGAAFPTVAVAVSIALIVVVVVVTVVIVLLYKQGRFGKLSNSSYI